MAGLEKIQKYLLPAVLVAWCAVLLAQKIDLPQADIGRHIKNGEIILHGSWVDKRAVLQTNFYSYTQTQHEFVNHHWLSGVIFYLIFQIFGFVGLSIFYIVLVSAAFYIFFRLAQKQAGSSVAAILAVLALPIIASRTEVRPEGFTYLLTAVFFWLLWNWQQPLPNPPLARGGNIIWLLPLTMLFWVNLHIGFIYGFIVLGAFWFRELAQYFLTKQKGNLYFLTGIILFCGAAGLINPFFLKGFLYPLNIFQEYGYLIVENQSVMFLHRLGLGSGLYFGLFKLLLGLSLASFVVRFVFEKNKRNFPFQNFLFLGSVGLVALLQIRNFPLFGLLFLPIVAANFRAVLPPIRHPAYRLIPALIALVVLAGGSFRFWESYEYKRASFGLGLMPQVEAAGEFFKSEKISGPIFNNYDIGGYLIFSLFPKEKVFTDNRPEAYSISHFQTDYIPAQQDSLKWKDLDNKYNFNSIFFSMRDLTPWGQAFLISKVQDTEWAPVYTDAYSIIFLKRNTQNARVISKYLIPPENFQIIPN